MWDMIVELANAGWNAWLLLMFVVAIAYALWPTKARQAQMDHAARIPIDDDAAHRTESRPDRPN
ncbi:MAG: cbb3-type cytochrome c oxidase subunit 3 [Alphaproteobacteria bacterium]|jgi:cbb3-type cytochrome oxidase subunit 3|uniref:cbb3-type cytochrome c oxidase subunit 3 n=1 Tax=Pacificispira sp. TaxID=2888761 RepID=UPI001B0C30D8|nr:cbb3-type cytochrome c oxidase subunit 3 [Alphaproteobacteria bacterium]MBO6863983.1 cbb3-type cytochrome c oxidase subunit 3 [Alphaproteobacteria bacterium]MEC9266328.1 cbb3-type cytochrome c oxidase subunit 3 [Pseudomonadota bacterium]